MPVYNPNYVGKDIVTGAKDIRQLVFGPRIIANSTIAVGLEPVSTVSISGPIVFNFARVQSDSTNLRLPATSM